MFPQLDPVGIEPHRLFPFGLVALFAFLLIPTELPITHEPVIVLAIGLCMAIASAEIFIPWERMPGWSRGAPALAFLFVVALLRHAEGESVSVYGPLALLPIVWFALYGSRRDLGTALLTAAALFALPVHLIGDAAHSVHEWRRGMIFLAVSGMIGLAIQQLVRQLDQRRKAAEEQAEALRGAERHISEQAANLSTVVAATREFATLESAETARRRICDAAVSIVGGDLAFFCEPGPSGTSLRVTASTESRLDGLEFGLGGGQSGVAAAFTDAKPVFAPLSRAHPLISQDMIAITRAESALAQPVLRDGVTVAVLCLGWYEVHPYLSDRRISLLDLLANEAANAIERANLMSRLSEMARTDELTGLPNRRDWEEALPRELARSKRTDRPLTVAMIDLDNFKDYNDLYGHQAGDRVLKQAAAAWQHELRATDILSRYGGEEFLLALPDCPIDAAQELAERLRGATPEGETCSIGIAQWNGTEPGESLVNRADAALYKAKSAGRDRVVASNWLPARRSAA